MREKRTQKMNSNHVHLMQTVFVAAITLSSRSLNYDNRHQWVVHIARYVVYISTLRAVQSISVLVFELVKRQKLLDAKIFDQVDRTQVMMYLGAVFIVFYNEQKVYTEDFPLICLANLIVSYQAMVDNETIKTTVTYGSGMACSYVEGYLVHVIPSDGRNYLGFQDNVKYVEAKQGIVFPVKKLFIIITKSMFCPPDLSEFNDKSDRDDVTRLEACQINDDVKSNNLQSFREVVKDVAGVKGRYYQNSAYKINRPNKRPVHVAAECATSIHTLYKVLKNKDLYDELAHMDPEVVVQEFMDTLSWILNKSPDLKNKCELVHFDDTDPNLNLADVLLDRIQELEPKFEEFVNKIR